jgi:arginase family enzyme
MFCRAIAEKHGSVGLLHIDAHSDTAPDMMGERLAHGTPFRYYIASNFNKGDFKNYFYATI